MMFRELSRREILRTVAASATIGGFLSGQVSGREEVSRLSFQELSPTAKELFRQALQEGEVTDVTGVDPEEVRSLMGTVYVEYRGDQYVVKGGRTYQSKDVFLPLETDDAIDEEDIVRYSELSGPGQTAFDAVASNGKPSAAVDSWKLNLPRDATAVADQRRGDGPDVRIAYGSQWAYRVTVSRRKTN